MDDARRLVRVWAVLIALTGVTGLAGRVATQFSLAPVLLILLALASMIKARLILSHYLDLRLAPGWNRAFAAILYALILIVYGLCLVPAFR